MSIKTEITPEDYVAFVKHVARAVSTSTPERMVRMFIGFAMAAGMGFGFSMLRVKSDPTAVSAMLFGLFGGIFIMMVVVSYASRRQIQRLTPAEDGFVLGSQETFLEDEGIRQKSAHHQSVYDWSLVRAIGITEQHVFVMLDPVAGIILPRRAFSSETEREQFVGEIERRSGKKRT